MENVDVPQRRIHLRGEIDDLRANETIAALLYFSMGGAAPITLNIDSHGGAVTAALPILDTMRFVQCPVHTACHGIAYGAALLLYSAGKRRFLSAQAKLGFTRFEWRSPAPEPRELFAKFRERVIQELALACGRSDLEVVRNIQGQRDFGAAEAIAFGLADELVN